MEARMREVVLLDGAGRRWLVRVGMGIVKVKGIGPVQTDGLERLVGRTVELGGGRYLVLSPSIRDLVETVRRKAQIIGPKDSPIIAFNCSLQAGDLVVEGGAGSGAMTIVLAHTVYPDGRVVSYEIRKDFLRIARANVERTGLADLVEFKEADVCEGIEEKDVKAVVLDIPEPWRAIPAAREALKPSGHLASFSPTVEQMRQTVLTLRESGFVDIWSLEVLERRMEVNRGTRPSFEMLGHTGYMTFARKALEPL
jgi:tRNA (adenine57-N1/adenine58-N1)-methyltransferase